jgi:nicotinate dehydrogenase subunit B
MDEIAASLKADPIQYRLRHLADPRLINVINAVAQKANWETRPSPNFSPFRRPGTGRGFSSYLHQTANGYAAMAADVVVNESTGEIRVTKVVTPTRGPSSVGWSH